MNYQINTTVIRPILAALVLSAAASMFTACDSGGDSESATGAPTASSGGNGGVTQTGGNPNVAVGESCTSGDSNKICLAVHFVTYTDSSGTPTATQNQAATIIHEMNTLWSQCDIGFQIENYDPEDPTKYGLSYGAASQNELNQIRGQFSNPNDELLGVTTGPWGTTVNAWTAMPGESVYGAVMEASIVTYGNGIIYGHEFGHYLGLDHVSDTSNLMNPVIYTTSTTLTSSQCQTARDTANSYWSAMLRK